MVSALCPEQTGGIDGALLRLKGITAAVGTKTVRVNKSKLIVTSI